MIAIKSGSRRRLLLGAALLCALALSGAACGSYTETVTNTKSAANETAAISALRTIASAQTAYSVTHEGNYGTFAELVKAGSLDARFDGEQPQIQGYALTMKLSGKGASGAASYSVNADPQSDVATAQTGVRHFYLNGTDNIIHVHPSRAANATDPIL